MLSQDHPGIDMERRAAVRASHGVAEQGDFVDQQGVVAVEQVDREEIGSARNGVAAIVGIA